MDENEINKTRLDNIIHYFYDAKHIAEDSKKEADDYNKEIKTLMSKMNIDTFKTENNLVAKITTQHKESFNEPTLIKKLTELNHTNIIDLIPTINYDKLEDAIYNGEIDANILAEYKIVKEVSVLKVTKKKGE